MCVLEPKKLIYWDSPLSLSFGANSIFVIMSVETIYLLIVLTIVTTMTVSYFNMFIDNRSDSFEFPCKCGHFVEREKWCMVHVLVENGVAFVNLRE